MTHDEVVWMAGFFDGEGSLAIQVFLPGPRSNTPTMSPRMAVKIKYGTEVLTLFHRHFGGKLYRHRESCASWLLMGNAALRHAVTTLLPFLRVKHDIAVRFLEALALTPSLKGINRYGGERAWTPENERKMMEIAISLNPPSAKNAKQKLQVVRIQEYLAKAAA